MRGAEQLLCIGGAHLESRQLTGHMIVAYEILACTKKLTWEEINSHNTGIRGNLRRLSGKWSKVK